MKRKYQGILSVGALLVMVSLLGAYYYSGLWRRVYTSAGPVQAPFVDSWMPSEEQTKTIQRLSGSLQAMAVPTGRNAESSSLVLFGQRTALKWNRDNGRDRDESASRAHGLSMTLLAGPVRYCTVNGAFVAEGARLKDGAVIVKIENQRVMIARGDKMEWLYLEDDSWATDEKNASGALPGKGSS